METKELLPIVAKNINLPGLVKEMMAGPLDQALQKLVDDTTMPFDNMAKAAVYPIVMEEVNKIVEAQWTKLVG